MAKKDDLTPTMRQIYDFKSKHPDAVLLFRCGDFYETYEQDAKVVSELLGITLIKRTSSPKGEGYMAGFPHHALDTYLPKLIRAGKRVAICDQLEDPRLAKKLVKMGVTETINNTSNKETMKLNLSNNQNESKNVQNAQVLNPAIAEPIEDAVIVSEEKAPLPAPPKGRSKKDEPKGKKSAQKNEAPNFSVVTYTTKKGGTACYIMGFASEADAKAIADQLPSSVSNSYRYNDKGEKVFILSFGTRYVTAAQTLCGALNCGDKKAVHGSIAACHDIYASAVAAGKAEREAKAQERKAKKQADDAKKLEAVKKKNGLYSMAEVAEMMQRVLNGEDVPELAAVKAALAAAA